MLREMRRKVEAGEIALARRTLAGFVEKVEVWPDHIVIHYHAPIGTELQGFRQLPPRGFALNPNKRLERFLFAYADLSRFTTILHSLLERFLASVPLLQLRCNIYFQQGQLTAGG
jgi:hypothetical protein